MITRPLPVWALHPRHSPAGGMELAAALGAPEAIGHVLRHRGIDDHAGALRFLDPVLAQLHDPLRLRGLAAAIERIGAALDRGERILIQADYDVDGITSAFLLGSVLRGLGGRVRERIPHRIRDGYGLTDAAVDEAARLGCALIVTVDCGITAIDPVARARQLGIDVVITDHHEPGATLPDACALVDPRREGCEYPFKSLAGVGVTFKVAQALLAARGVPERALDYLDVVALGTIADVVPMVDENRTLARVGLERLRGTSRPGLRALMQVAGLGERPVTAAQVAFVLAPRMNAAGRMGHADQALRLLLARDAGEAMACAESLEDDNRRRRLHDEQVAKEAAERVERELGWPECASILLWSESWHPGVIGIVASRLVERYHRPTILVALQGERGRGSGRGVPGIDLTAALTHCEDLLDAHGGHAFAAGLSVRRDRLPALRERLEAYVRSRLDLADAGTRVEIDADVALPGCDLRLIEWLDRVGPHGLDNPEPLFRTEGVTLESMSTVGGGRHLRLQVRDGAQRAEAIGFGMAGLAPTLRVGGLCSLCHVPTRNEWNGATRIQLRLRGARPA